MKYFLLVLTAMIFSSPAFSSVKKICTATFYNVSTFADDQIARKNVTVFPNFVPSGSPANFSVGTFSYSLAEKSGNIVAEVKYQNGDKVHFDSVTEQHPALVYEEQANVNYKGMLQITCH